MSLVLVLAFPAQVAAAPPALPHVRARGDLSTTIGIADYPEEARLANARGTVHFELDVDPRGRVTACRIGRSSGHLLLDELTCRIMADRARFTPARNRMGIAVSDVIRARITWEVPPPPPAVRARAEQNLASYVANGDYPAEALRREEQGTVAFELDISPQGRVTACHILGRSGSQMLDLQTCRIMIVRARFEPARDANGAAVADVVGARITWAIQP